MERVLILGIMVVLVVAFIGVLLISLIIRRGPRIVDERPYGILLFTIIALSNLLVGLFFTEGVRSVVSLGTAILLVLGIVYILLGPTTLMASHVSEQVMTALIISILERRGLRWTKEANTIRLLGAPLSIKVRNVIFNTRVLIYSSPDSEVLCKNIVEDLSRAVERLDSGTTSPVVQTTSHY